MKRRIPPTSDQSRHLWLQRLLHTHAKRPGQLPETMIEEARQLEAPFKAAIARNTSLLADRTKQVILCDQYLDTLAKLVRAFWNTLKVRTQIEGHSVEILKLHGLFISGKRPIPRVKRDWMHWAKIIMEGEAHAVTLGYPSMAAPFGSMIETVYAEADAACLKLDEVAFLYQENLGTLIALRKRINNHYDHIARYFGFLLANQPKPTRRERMRRYGYIFEGDYAPKRRKPKPEPTPEPEPEVSEAETPATPEDSSEPAPQAMAEAAQSAGVPASSTQNPKPPPDS